MTDRNQSVHFIAIGGIGMSALAKILLSMGCRVSGSDVRENDVIRDLADAGAVIHIGHDAKNLPDDCGEVIYSSAIAEDNPELLRAKELGLAVTHRGALLARLFNGGRGIAVAGAHGKTTTSGMIAHILELEEKQPNIVLGGILPLIGSNAKKGAGDLWVVEADESDGSFLKLRPYRTVITNIEPEHMNYYKTEENLEDSFLTFAGGSEELILCLDDKRTRELASRLDKGFCSYGLGAENADLTAKNLKAEGFGVEAEVWFKGEHVADLALKVPGEHNIANALAAMYATYLEGVPFAAAAERLRSFTGTGRRFDVLYNRNGVVVVDDYAHHPTEVRATIKAAKDGGFQRVVAVFQPHRYSRVKELYKEFGASFGDADVVIIDDIYSAWEEKIEGVSSAMIVAEAEKNGAKPLYFGDGEKLLDYLAREHRPGDILLLMGAGNIRDTSERLCEILMGDEK